MFDMKRVSFYSPDDISFLLCAGPFDFFGDFVRVGFGYFSN